MLSARPSWLRRPHHKHKSAENSLLQQAARTQAPHQTSAPRRYGSLHLTERHQMTQRRVHEIDLFSVTTTELSRDGMPHCEHHPYLWLYLQRSYTGVMCFQILNSKKDLPRHTSNSAECLQHAERELLSSDVPQRACRLTALVNQRLALNSFTHAASLPVSTVAVKAPCSSLHHQLSVHNVVIFLQEWNQS